jgi:PKD repeat protein
VISSTEKELSWTNNATYATHMVVQRQKDGGAWGIWGFVDTTQTTVRDNQLTAGSTYNYKLAARNAAGLSDFISPGGGAPPVANFSGNPTSGTAPLTVYFTDSSTNTPTSWSWTFGDGGTSTAQNPSHQYTSANTYTVALTATNSYGSDGETKTNYITVTALQPPVANFSGNPTSGMAPLTVNFTDSSTNSPTSWSWTFGDGGTSTAQNPSHQYTSANTYTVALTATNAAGYNTNTKTNYITVTALQPPVANFSGNPTSGNAPLTVNFTDSSTNSPTSWSWTFGDGGTSTAQNPSHQYTSAAQYTVSLTATNAAGSDGETKTNYITVQTASMPTFVAAGTVASGTGAITPALPAGIATNDILLLFLETANQLISITNQNGGTWTEVTNSPQGTGTAAGSSATRLTVFWSRYNGTQGAPTTSDSGNHQLGRIVAIRGAATSGNPWDVTAGGVEATSDTSGAIPGATTTVGNTLVVAGIATNLPDATGTANFSAWANANLSSVTERTDNTVTAGNGGGLGLATGGMANAGAYGNTTVTCATAATKGMMSIALKAAGPAAPVANFSGAPTSGAPPLTVNFTDSSTNTPTSWSWTFGDGGTSTAQNPSHQYTSENTYTVSLTATNAYGSDDETKTNYITVSSGGLPSPWQNQDVGSPAAAGNASYSSGTFTIEGDGSDMWGTSDSFHYVYQAASGDCTIVARVATQENTSSLAKAGVNIRETLTGGSKSAYMVITPSDGAAFGWRATTGGSTTDAGGGDHPAPYWVKLVRSGDNFTASESANGTDWTQVGSTQTITMATVYIGLPVCSASSGTLCTATIDNVTATP